MANKNKKTNELVSDDDDPTTELEALTVRHPVDVGGFRDVPESESESDLNTFDFSDVEAAAENDLSIVGLKSDLKRRSETIEKLQFDIQQLHSKWLGLETEIKAREELTENISADLKTAERKLTRKEKLLAKRDRSIKALKAEIREREKAFRDLTQVAEDFRRDNQELRASEEVTTARRQLDEQSGLIASHQATIGDMQQQQQRTEAYADELRRQLSDLASVSEGAVSERMELRTGLERARSQVSTLQTEVEAALASATASKDALQETHQAHEQELRLLRFELGEAEETLAENEQINEQLASDLIDTRNFRDQLERMLTDNEGQSQARIAELEKQVRKLEDAGTDYQQKLGAKAEAINCLLAELAKKSQEVNSIGEMENVIHEIDDRMSERIDERPQVDRDRITRLLIGQIDNQELRFPLFKNRLTIGRTQQNDIQLKAHYISRRHAVVVTEGDATRVIDWGSKNGVYVNSKRVTEHFLRNGDVVTIGTAEFRYEERPKRDA